jgi:hypothetical protein
MMTSHTLSNYVYKQCYQWQQQQQHRLKDHNSNRVELRGRTTINPWELTTDLLPFSRMGIISQWFCFVTRIHHSDDPEFSFFNLSVEPAQKDGHHALLSQSRQLQCLTQCLIFLCVALSSVIAAGTGFCWLYHSWVLISVVSFSTSPFWGQTGQQDIDILPSRAMTAMAKVENIQPSQPILYQPLQ